MADSLILRPYQESMRAFAGSTTSCALWAGMGLGKTPTALHVMQDSLFDRLDIERWLVIAPKLVASDAWPRQLRHWRDFQHMTWRNLTAADLGLRADIDKVTGRRTGFTFGPRDDKLKRKKILLGHREHVHLASWDSLPWLVRAYGVNWPYDGMVLDEAIFSASATSIRHKAVWHVVQNLKRVSRVIELTGAPTPNGYEQLHGQIRLLDGGERLGKSMTDFRGRWMEPDTWDRRGGIVYKWKLRRGAKEEIDQRLAGLVVSLRSEDYLDLPECLVNPVYVDLPDNARRLYEQLEADALIELGKDVTIISPNAAVLTGKLLQICNGAIYDEGKKAHQLHTVKLDRLDELMEGANGPVLLAYSYEHDWQRISARFKSAVHIKAPGALDRFRRGEIKLLCMHPASGAHGVDGLQEASSTAVWFGATYNADHWLQFAKRLHRDGQRADRVVVHQLLADNTIENYVAGQALTAKVAEQNLLLEALDMRRLALQSRVSVADTK